MLVGELRGKATLGAWEEDRLVESVLDADCLLYYIVYLHYRIDSLKSDFARVSTEGATICSENYAPIGHTSA